MCVNCNLRHRPAIWSILLILVLLCGVAWLAVAQLMITVRSSRESAIRTTCDKNLKIIGAALLSYANAHGSFPPEYSTDLAGRRMHSWRVLILPYLGEGSVYSQIHLDEPWDSPKNQQLKQLMPKYYRCRDEMGTNCYETSYLAVAGPHSVLCGAKGMSLLRINDKKAVMVAEVADSGVNWMEPRDLVFDLVGDRNNGGMPHGFHTHHGHYLLVNGTVLHWANDHWRDND